MSETMPKWRQHNRAKLIKGLSANTYFRDLISNGYFFQEIATLQISFGGVSILIEFNFPDTFNLRSIYDFEEHDKQKPLSVSIRHASTVKYAIIGTFNKQNCFFPIYRHFVASI